MSVARNVTVIVPVYGDIARTEACLRSCLAHVDGRHRLLVVDDAGPEPGMEQAVRAILRDFPGAEYRRNPENLGFVRTCNRAVLEWDHTDNDILLLNADTVVTEGFLEEMRCCLYASERNAVVCPRSDNATLLTVPGPDAHARWKALREDLPRLNILPTGVGFCMLIRRSVLREYGLFDPAYGQGYGEENDFCSRIGRHGYSTVMANRAFVHHAGGASFTDADRARLQGKHELLLRKRYPEYDGAQTYMRWHRPAAEHFAALLPPRSGKRCVAVDLSHLPASHNGTSEYVLRLLPGLQAAMADCEIRLIANRPCALFFRLESFGLPVDDTTAALRRAYDLVFVPSQLYSLDHLEYVNRIAPRIAMTFHDDIALRCHQLHTNDAHFAFRASLDAADGCILLSESGRNSVGEYAASTGGTLPPHRIIRHGFSVREASGGRLPRGVPERFALVVGNGFAHKRVAEALAALPEDLPVVALGAGKGGGRNVTHVRSGFLTEDAVDALYAHAAFVVFPTAYEGVGFPVLHAAAHGKAVLVSPLEPFRELEHVYGVGPYLRRCATLREMGTLSAALWRDTPVLPPWKPPRTWEDCARETADFLRGILEAPPSPDLERRFRFLLTTQMVREQERNRSISLYALLHRRIGHGLNRWPRTKMLLKKMLRSVP